MKPVDLIGWLGGLVLSGGDHHGRLMEVWPWERRFVRGVWSREGDAALSVGRGNGKSGLVAGVSSAVVDPEGPLHRPRGEVICVASSFQQSRIIFEDLLGFMGQRHNLEDRKVWRKQDSAQLAILEHRPTGSRIRCLGADPRRAHGLRPLLVLADEPAQWPANTADKMLAAVRTAMGKVPGSRLVALGTRSDSEAHWFSKLLKSAPYAQVHAAPPDAPPFRLSTIRRANPSIEYLPSLKARILGEREDARRDPDRLAEWKALRLNLGVSDTAVQVLLDADVWRRAVGEESEGRGGAVWGIDLGSGQAMSAVAAYYPSGRLEVVAAFPELPNLAERGLADGVGRQYVRMGERGELITVGRRVVDLRRLLSEALGRFGRPAAVVCDRWRDKELRDALEAIGFPQAALVIRGQGYKDGSEDVRGVPSGVFLRGGLRPRPACSSPRLWEKRGRLRIPRATRNWRRPRRGDVGGVRKMMLLLRRFWRWQPGTGSGRRLPPVLGGRRWCSWGGRIGGWRGVVGGRLGGGCWIGTGGGAVGAGGMATRWIT